MWLCMLLMLLFDRWHSLHRERAYYDDCPLHDVANTSRDVDVVAIGRCVDIYLLTHRKLAVC